MSALSYQDVQVHFNNADSTLYKRAFSDICKYCASPLIVWRNSALWEQFEVDKKWAFKICTQCGYWMYYCDDIWDGSILITEAVLQKFNLGDDKVPLEAVEVELSKNWKLSKHISAGRAEDLVAKIFAEHMECEIEYLTDSVYSADRGIDFVLVTKVNGTRSAFQVKRRIRSGSESVVPVRAFVGATANSSYDHAFYVTTADQFSKAVEKEFHNSDSLKRRNLQLNLVDGRKLSEMLRLRDPVGKIVLAHVNPDKETVFRPPFSWIQEDQFSENRKGKGYGEYDGITLAEVIKSSVYTV